MTEAIAPQSAHAWTNDGAWHRSLEAAALRVESCLPAKFHDLHGTLVRRAAPPALERSYSRAPRLAVDAPTSATSTITSSARAWRPGICQGSLIFMSCRSRSFARRSWPETTSCSGLCVLDASSSTMGLCVGHSGSLRNVSPGRALNASANMRSSHSTWPGASWGPVTRMVRSSRSERPCRWQHGPDFLASVCSPCLALSCRVSLKASDA